MKTIEQIAQEVADGERGHYTDLDSARYDAAYAGIEADRAQRDNPDYYAKPTPQTARANRTLQARAAADLAGDTLTAVYDALRAADGMPTWEQLAAFKDAANVLVGITYQGIEEQEQS